MGSDTRLEFRQKGSRVFAHYGGGTVRRGWLVGEIAGSTLTFRYAQVESAGEIHAGSSICDVLEQADGRMRILEHFAWRTRKGSGTNVFDELLRRS